LAPLASAGQDRREPFEAVPLSYRSALSLTPGYYTVGLELREIIGLEPQRIRVTLEGQFALTCGGIWSKVRITRLALGQKLISPTRLRKVAAVQPPLPTLGALEVRGILGTKLLPEQIRYGE
jgi:hypothetical protein